MNREDLVRRIADKYSVNIKDTKLWVDAFFDVLTDAVVEDDVKIRNFGNFELHKMKAKTARNLKSGETMYVPERMKLYFVPCPKLLNRVRAIPVTKEETVADSE